MNMRIFSNILIAGLLLFCAAGTAQAQIKTPQPSPMSKVTQEVGLMKVEVEYSRPSSKGRKVFGDLVPFGELWRTGANASTKVTFGDDVRVAGNPVAKGTYALYSIPGEKEWTIVIYRNTTFWGTPGKEYKEEDVAAQFNVPVLSQREMVESFTISFNNLRNNGCDMELSWKYTKIVVPITVDTDAKVLADIKSQLDGPSANTFYGAARYYFEEKKDMNQALDWVSKAIEKGGEKFWILRLKAQILAELGRFRYRKQQDQGYAVPVEMRVYLLSVDSVSDRFPEDRQRKRRWFAPVEAARMVVEPGLKQILAGLDRPDAA